MVWTAQVHAASSFTIVSTASRRGSERNTQHSHAGVDRQMMTRTGSTRAGTRNHLAMASDCIRDRFRIEGKYAEWPRPFWHFF
jgi:hypothetical protein